MSMGGISRVESSRNGTIFTVKLPCVQLDLPKDRQENFMKHLHILVVDDKKVIGDFFNLTMGYYGHHITVVHDLPHTLEAIKHHQFDIAFMDMMMPDNDGVEILKEVKAITPELPVVMMSGYSLDEKRQQAKLLGAVDCLKKPFEVDDIRRVVKEAIGQEI